MSHGSIRVTNEVGVQLARMIMEVGGAPKDDAWVAQAQAAALVPNPGEWSVMAWSLDRNQPLFAINADKAMIPASNNKVYSAIWALAVLGPDYRFPTDVLITGPVQNGVVRGDVVIRGSGDPAFGYAEYDKDPLTSPRATSSVNSGMGHASRKGTGVKD